MAVACVGTNKIIILDPEPPPPFASTGDRSAGRVNGIFVSVFLFGIHTFLRALPAHLHPSLSGCFSFYLCPSIRPCICPSIRPSVHPPIHPFIRPSVNHIFRSSVGPSIYLLPPLSRPPVSPWVVPSAHPPVCLSAHHSVHPSGISHTYQPSHDPTSRPSVHPSTLFRLCSLCTSIFPRSVHALVRPPSAHLSVHLPSRPSVHRSLPPATSPT